MVAAALKRYRTAGIIALWSVVVLGALMLLALSARNSAQFNRLQPWILAASAAAVLAFAILLARKIMHLVRDYRAGVPGSRLTARTVFVFGLLVILPLLAVYLFSLEFLDRGIDSWFRTEVRSGLNDAVDLSRAALELRMREHAERTEALARRLTPLSDLQTILVIDEERRSGGAREIVLYGEHERILAVSSGTAESMPSRPPEDLLRQINAGRTYMILEPQGDSDYVIRTAARVDELRGQRDSRYVMAVYPVPRQLAALGDAVQKSISLYGNLAAAREPLKTSFRLTLTLVLLVTMLAAIYGAIFSAQILFKPVQDLMEGTRAVAKGDYGTRLPLSSRDEMGFLVQSFNEMTKRLRRAREETSQSQLAVERERERLAVILARLSSGVIVLDHEHRMRIVNEAAGGILGLDAAARLGRSLAEVGAASGTLQLLREVDARLASGREEWREQFDFATDAGRRSLTCACLPLPSVAQDRGYVIVFDDITTLLQAQRDAAWGEVARRLAHEIKNPLTPIQLSAERMRRRFLPTMNTQDAEILDRATNTIVQQVEAMKAMVDAFSEYARAPDMNISRFSVNGLVAEVTDLYRSQDTRVDFQLTLDPNLDMLEADRGRIRQILNNLLTNAIEALEGVAQPRVEVTTRLQAAEQEDGSDALLLAVADNGSGFQRELLDRIFEPYVTSKPRGTGLGLAIVKKIVEEHGGRIEAENRTEGGARVRVTLPIADRSRHAARGDRRPELRRERA